MKIKIVEVLQMRQGFWELSSAIPISPITGNRDLPALKTWILNIPIYPYQKLMR
jgi:uncharacterized membrane protein (DUF2068 family)